MMNLEKPLPYSPLSDSVSEFHRWKQARKKYITMLGPQFLSLSDEKLNAVFKKWEFFARNDLKNKKNSTIMIGLFHLSMLFYFHRTLAAIDDLVPKISNFIVHKSRCICKTSARVLLYLSQNSKDNVTSHENLNNSNYLNQNNNNINFFHDFFNKSWMSFEQKSPYLFSTLIILDEANTLVPSTVRSIVTPNFDSILTLAFSDDLEIQDAVFPVISHHLTVSCDQFSKFALFSICMPNITTKQSVANMYLNKSDKANRGSLYLIKLLIRLGLSNDQLSLILTNFVKSFLNSQDENIILICFEILILLFERKEILYNLDNSLMQSLTQSIIKSIKKFLGSKEIMSKFIRLLHIMPYEIYPTNDILEFACNIFGGHVKIQQKFAYFLIYLIFGRFPNFQLNFKIPFDSTFSKYFRKLLKLKPSLVIENQKKLNQFFENGISPNLSKQQIIDKLKVARACGVLLWGSTQNLLDNVKNLHLSESEDIRKEVIKIIGQFDDQVQLVIHHALFDDSAKVRFVSLTFLKDTKKINILLENSLISKLLADQSPEVLHKVLEIVSTLVTNNPMLYITSLFYFHKRLQQSYLRCESLYEASSISTIFPELAHIFVQTDPELSKSLAGFCVYVLMRGKDESSVISDTFINKELLNPFTSSNQSLRNSIFRLVHLPLLDQCDINFLKTIEILNDYVNTKHLKEIFTSFLEEKRSKIVILSSLRTLTSFVPYLKFDMEFNKPFFKVLNETSSKKVARAIYEFFGTAGVSEPPPIDESSSKYQRNSIVDYSTTMVKIWIFESLVSLVPNQLQSFFEASTNAIILYPNFAPKYLGKLIPEFVQSLSVRQNDTIVNQLISITKEMKNFMTPFLDILQPILIERLDNEHCVRLCRVLSCVLLNNFIPYCSKLFHKAASISQMDIEKDLLKQLLKFLSFSVIFQNQPINILLQVYESVCEKVPEIVIFELVRILQNSLSISHVPWITRIFIKIRNHPSAMQLMYSIAIFGNISFSLLNSILKKYSINDKNFLELEKKSFTNQNLPFFVATIHAKLKDEPISRQDFDVFDIFSTITPPVNNNIDQWVQDFVQVVVGNSPNRGIRFCSDLANQSSQFRDEIIAPAFLTCWVVTPSYQQEEFLGIFRYIVENFQPLPSTLFNLIDLMDSCRMSLPISFRDLALTSQYPAQSLHYWKNFYRQNPTDIDLYLEQCMKMGLLDTARGVLNSTIKTLGSLNVSEGIVQNSEKWSEKLGDWSAALRKHKLKNNIPGIIRCYGHLQNWPKILQFESQFTTMKETEKAETSIWFGWTFYFQGEYSKAQSFIKYFPGNESQSHFYLKVFILIKNKEFDKALQLINKMKESMSIDHSIFDGTNPKLAEEKLNFAQHLIELKEVINYFMNNENETPIMWNIRNPLENRVNDCTELTNIRSLLLSDEMKLKIALKMSASLRKVRQSEIFKGTYFRLLRIKRTPDVMVEGIKMLWSKGIKSSAITFFDILIGIYSNRTQDWLLKKYKTIKKSSLKYLGYFKDDFINNTSEYKKHNPVSMTDLWKYKRILINWKLQEKTANSKRLTKYNEILKGCVQARPKDIKTLLDYSLLNMRMLDNIETGINEIAAEAISNFLKIIELSSNDNLSVLLLLLNILSRCANDFTMNTNVVEKLKNLPSSLVSKSLPQLINLLAHNCYRLQETVRYILLNFGNKRFQKLFFSLHIGLLSNNKERSKHAEEIFNILKKTHAKLADDLILFVNGMDRSAVSLLEEWKYGIEDARRLFEHQEVDKSIEILRNLLIRLKNPRCELDRSFGRLIYQHIGNGYLDAFNKLDFLLNESKKNTNKLENNILNEESNNIDNENNSNDKCENGVKNLDIDANNKITDCLNVLWGKLYHVFDQICRKVNQLAMISLQTVSEELVSRRDLLVVVPGTHDTAKIQSIDTTLTIFATAFHPRFVKIIDENGKRHNFLLKGNCDVRIDYRIMQFFLLINSLLSSNRSTSSLSITQYSIVPITKNSGLISWVENSDSLHQIINHFPTNRAKENDIIKTNYQLAMSTMSSMQLCEMFWEIADKTEADELDMFLWLKAPSSSIWMSNSMIFVSSVALMSIAGYIIGLGDRHPNNILLQKHNGKIAHIDFGDVFEITMNRDCYPEKVPFRLTRMIENALDGGNANGLFKKTCENVLSLIRDSKQTILSQFDLFTMDSTIMSNPKFDGARIMERVKEKLSGFDSRLKEDFVGSDKYFDMYEDSSTENFAEESKEDGIEEHSAMSVEEQVKKLIYISSDPNRYATHYVGWCSYW
ncbi:hypothetical protein TRFO_41155 [Tritrichomonas foetus]|uniref:non-specific serine/threonine protein kinase n=1 Tax=Tritrichomonas foetus TaxID=1144522 RepID=A0A1J4L176_9EUKA|nr:hypothetical protein TRFO_41155 [Tritrichomonas foetus]|eukprot:OHT17271.1 hypothetical protein TRFO_41155 [Tritrichomonas foetus]